MTELSMKVSSDVILDLLPLYMAGEASTATRSLVEQYLSQDDALALAVRTHHALGPGIGLPVDLPPELELRSLARTRALLRGQRWLFGVAIGLTVLALTSELSIRAGRIVSFRLLLLDYPAVFVPVVIGALGCWVAYFRTARRLRTR